MNSDILVDELNTKVVVRIAPSKIHGVGIFAIRDLPKGRKMYMDEILKVYPLPYSSFNKLFPEVRDILLERWPQIVNGSAFIYPDSRYQAYCNHSDDPNYNAEDDVLLKDVKAGEEITEDYKKINNWEKAFPFLTCQEKK